MIRPFAFIVLFLHLTGLSFSQSHDSAWTKEINLPRSDYINLSKRILLFNSDTFAIYSSLDMFVDNLRKFIKEYDVEEDTKLLNKLLDKSKSLNGTLSDIQNDQVLRFRLNFRTAELIQKRKCLVYNKTSKVFESKLLVTNYIKNWWTGIKFSTQTNQAIIDLRTGAF
jgi:hypothetical protein